MSAGRTRQHPPAICAPAAIHWRAPSPARAHRAKPRPAPQPRPVPRRQLPHAQPVTRRYSDPSASAAPQAWPKRPPTAPARPRPSQRARPAPDRRCAEALPLGLFAVGVCWLRYRSGPGAGGWDRRHVHPSLVTRPVAGLFYVPAGNRTFFGQLDDTPAAEPRYRGGFFATSPPATQDERSPATSPGCAPVTSASRGGRSAAGGAVLRGTVPVRCRRGRTPSSC